MLVPFAGSGVTIVSAYELGCKAVGYDLAQHFKEAYIARLVQEVTSK